VTRVSRMQGRPRILSGFTVIRSNAIGIKATPRTCGHGVAGPGIPVGHEGTHRLRNQQARADISGHGRARNALVS
jgi:hypothetical protein